MELTDGVVLVRAFRDDDIRRIVEACSDPDTPRFVPGIPVPYTEQDARDYLRLVAELRAGGERLPFAIAHPTSSQLLGAIDVSLGADETGSVGYWMHPAARGAGHATRALVLVSRWAIEQRGIERLSLTTHPENIASQRVAEKAGFVREGILRSHIRFREGRRDSVLFSLIRADLEIDEPG